MAIAEASGQTFAVAANATHSNRYIDSLLWGGWKWVTTGSPVPIIKYYFAVENEGTPYADTWTTIEKDAYRAAAQSWANVANITFQEVGSAAQATFIEHSVQAAFWNNVPPGWVIFGEHDVPDNPAPAEGYYNWQTGWGWDYDDPNGGLNVGGFGYMTLVHELGHGLGLAHPHDNGGGSGVFPGVTVGDSGDRGDNNLNNDIMTVMSYVHGWISNPNGGNDALDNFGFVAGPMAFDIAAIQYLYGANMNYMTGNNTYFLPEVNALGTFYTCICDAGGLDTI
jgi:serralysin